MDLYQCKGRKTTATDIRKPLKMNGCQVLLLICPQSSPTFEWASLFLAIIRTPTENEINWKTNRATWKIIETIFKQRRYILPSFLPCTVVQFFWLTKIDLHDNTKWLLHPPTLSEGFKQPSHTQAPWSYVILAAIVAGSSFQQWSVWSDDHVKLRLMNGKLNVKTKTTTTTTTKTTTAYVLQIFQQLSTYCLWSFLCKHQTWRNRSQARKHFSCKS